MRTHTWFLPLVAVLLFTACSADGPREAAVAEQPVTTGTADASSPSLPVPPAEGLPRIVFLGDSLTAGLGLQPVESIPSLVQQRLNDEGYRYEVINAGVSGDTSAGGLRRLDYSLQGPVELLVVELGANDGLRGLPISQLKENLTQVITTARRRGITVVLTGMEAPPNYGEAYTSEFRGVYRELASEQHVPFVPFFLEGVAGDPALNQRDGIHPNAEGARIISELMFNAIEPLLEKRDS
ncbi:MAG: arylesterase [Vicinamibacterales bacterium]